MSKLITFRINAKNYEDFDNCLSAAADDIEDAMGMMGYDISAKWEDNNREVILVTAPCPHSNDAAGWDRLREIVWTFAISDSISDR